MDSLLNAVILGLVEGFTEFLPVSSTGHLIITSGLLGLSGQKIDVFEIVIQTGAILAVIFLYWPIFWHLLFPCKANPGQTVAVRPERAFSGLRGITLLVLTSLPPSILGLLAYGFIKSLFTPAAVVTALGVGAIMMLVIEHWVGKKDSVPGRGELQSLDELGLGRALAIGFFQCLALWPGFSRSASTIMGGMILGLNRRLAAEYSFIAAVPLICGASILDLASIVTRMTWADLSFFLVGTVVSFFAALLAIKTFIALLGRVTLRPFAVYRLLIIIPVYWVLVH